MKTMGAETKPHEGEPTPQNIFSLLLAFQQTAALRGAIELDLFTAIGLGKSSVSDLAAHCQAAERGIRILCDALVAIGLLTKEADRYGLTEEAARFLDRASPTRVGDVAKFMGSETITSSFRDIAETVRRGGTILEGNGTLEPDHPAWVEFAGSMAPLAEAVASLLESSGTTARKVLDIAAGHGLFGISVARRSEHTDLVALDWRAVVEVARENAECAGLSGRFCTVAGSAFEVDLGSGYDLVLLPNFLHHFSRQECVDALQRIHQALAPGGRVAIVEFIPDENRVASREPALFALTMLATTPNGDAYTFAEYASMLAEAGFLRHRCYDLEGFPPSVVVSVNDE